MNATGCAAAALVLCLVAAADDAAKAAKPEPGPLDPLIAQVADRTVVLHKGTPQEALQAFLRAHELQKRGDLDAALAALLEFESIDGNRELPARYRTVVAHRLEGLLEGVAKRYDAACALYLEDRARGRDALRDFIARYADLPHGHAARALLQSDVLHEAIAAARTLDAAKKREEACKRLEAAINENPFGLYRYEAKSLLKEMGGPDLLKEETEGRGEEEEPKVEISEPGK